AEVGAQPRTQVACPAHVEQLLVPVVEEVHARPRRRAVRELALVPHAPRPRRCERDELGDGPRAAFLREPDQREQHLCGRLRVAPRSCRSVSPVSAETVAPSGTRGSTSVSNSSTSSNPWTSTAPISQICEDPGRRPVVSRSTTT